MTHSPADVHRLLDEHGLRPSRALGQNFVVDPNTVRRIVRLADLGRESSVVEVGAGLGSLTLALAETGARVLAVEVDRHLVPVLRRVVADAPGTERVSVFEADALTVDWSALLGGPVDGPWSLVANLPYNVAVPVVLRVLEEAPTVDSLLVMVQREVGERLAAGVGDPAYGAVSVRVAYWATAAVVGRVPATVFLPRPKVESVLVRLVRRPVPAVDPAVVDYDRLRTVVRSGFAHRRKMLRTSTLGVVDPDAFDRAGVAPSQRAEELDVAAWGRLAATGDPGR